MRFRNHNAVIVFVFSSSASRWIDVFAVTKSSKSAPRVRRFDHVQGANGSSAQRVIDAVKLPMTPWRDKGLAAIFGRAVVILVC
jgi:hypothetical protein